MLNPYKIFLRIVLVTKFNWMHSSTVMHIGKRVTISKAFKKKKKKKKEKRKKKRDNKPVLLLKQLH